MSYNKIYPNAMVGWPAGMYADENHNEKGAILCLAKGCTTKFATIESVERQVMHYTECELDTSLSDICRNEHGLLRRMHTIKRCLICTGMYAQRDARELFEHVTKHHPRDPDMFTVNGFLTNVREWSHHFRIDRYEWEDFRLDTFILSYQHLWLSLREADNWPAFCDYMGYRGEDMPEEEFRKAFTMTNDFIKYYPLDPKSFLEKPRRYEAGEHDLTKEEFKELTKTLQDLYRNGSI